MGLDIKQAYEGTVTYTRSTPQAGQVAGENFLSSSFVGQGSESPYVTRSTQVTLCKAKCILYSQTAKNKTKQIPVGWQAGDPGKSLMQFHSKGQQVETQES